MFYTAQCHCSSLTRHGTILQAAADKVTGKHSHLTLLINTAGVLHIPGVLSPGLSFVTWSNHSL